MRRHHICTKKKRLYFSCSMCVGGWQKLSSLLSFVTIKLRRFFFSLNYTNTLFVQHRIWPDPAHAPQSTTHFSQYRQEKKKIFCSPPQQTIDVLRMMVLFCWLLMAGWLAAALSRSSLDCAANWLRWWCFAMGLIEWVALVGWWKKSTLGRRRDVIVGAAAAAAANNTVSTPFLLLMLIFFSAILCVRCDDDDDEDIGIVVGVVGSVVEREKKRERTTRAYAAMFNKMRRDDFFLGEFKKKFWCTKIWWRQSPRDQTKTRLNI